MTTKNTQKGMTLIELVLYIGITATLLLSVSVFWSVMVQNKVKTETVAEVEQQGRFIMERMLFTLRNAEAVLAPLPGNSAASITVDVIDVLDDPTVYARNGNVLQETQGAQDTVDITSPRVNITDLSFTNISYNGTPGALRVQFTLSRVNPEGRNEYQYSQIFYGTATLK